MKRFIHALYVGFLLSAFSIGTGSSSAQGYPSKPVKVLVPFVAGGTSDIVARAVAHKLNEAGYTTVVENRPGANGSIAAEALAKAPADGYTIIVGSIGVFSINMGLYRISAVRLFNWNRQFICSRVPK